ncbi:TerB family tellurite resistance protein [candidate division CSSED10-310 bacterium]|uniref:TerB family tellurite resistance protein n=1 Tax=candidate division CSSED10-310 bacterium TaxID=2855610 RepID=A0ABV6YTZ5_UNCC1
MMEDEKHPLTPFSIPEKKAYLCIVASLASADREVSDDEISNLRKLCKKVGLDARSMGEVLAAAEDPDSAPLQEYLKQMAESELRFTLVTDMLFLAYADEKYSQDEREVVARIALELKVNSEQLSAIENYVQAVTDMQKTGTSAEMKKLGGDVTAGLASAGIPIAAVAVSGTVWGLSTAGIVSGLLALGMGLGMATGVGVVAVLGVASYFGVRWLYRKMFND